MTQTNTGTAAYTLSNDYTAPRDEWAALLTLAAKPDPARTVNAGEWKAAYFASTGARDAFEQIAEAKQPLAVTPPPSLADVAQLADPAELPKLRERLANLAQWRKVADLQANLAAHNLAMLNALGTEAEAEMLRRGRELVSSSIDALSQVDRMARGPVVPEMVTLGALADPDAFWARISEQRDAIHTGLGALDRMLGGGLQAKRLVVLLGGPGAGKTALSNQIAEHAADSGRPVVYLSLEEPASVMLAKTAARIGGLDYGAVLAGRETLRGAINGTLRDMQRRKSASRLLYVEDALDGRPIQPEQLRDLVGEHFAKFSRDGRGLLVVDYLQRWARALAATPGEKREIRVIVSTLSERLRQLARELDCAVITLSSQNRASGYGRDGGSNGNVLASAKESGDIEYSSDVLMGLDKDENRKARGDLEPRTLTLAKNRQGPGGKIALDWNGKRQQFTEEAD